MKMNSVKEEADDVCMYCKFFMPDDNPDSTRGVCAGMPTETVAADGYDIPSPKRPRIDGNDDACGLFRRK